jgi:hypothetical protein
MVKKIRTEDSKHWKRGRGKLGFLAPLIGTWEASASTPMGQVTCTRTFEPSLGGHYIRLTARWNFDRGVYEEIAMIGVKSDGQVAFWSFTSDGKNSSGAVADVSDIHPEAIGFEAQMPAGLARMAYWPDDSEGFRWAVEAKNKKGWKRFTEHHYKRI